MPAPRKSLFSSLASDSSHPQLPEALLTWVRSLPSTRQLAPSDDDDDASARPDGSKSVRNLKDLMDGIVLGRILLDIDPDHFNPLSAALSNSKALSENWVLRFNNLKRLYKLLIRYFEDILSSSTSELHTPNLQLVAKGDGRATAEESPEDEVCKLVGLVLALAVQSEQRLQHIERIQSLEEWVQRELMYSIEQVMSKVHPISDRDKTLEIDADSEFYQIQHEKSRLMHDKEALQVVYEDLVEQFNSLKEEHEETLAAQVAAEARAAELEQRSKSKETLKNEQALKAEIDRLRSDLQATANQLGESEANLEKQTRTVEDLSRKVEDLTPLASEASRLKDRLDEYKHTDEKAKKMENVLDKYKKKLDEAQEWKRSIKTLEDENADLLDKNTALEEENSKLSTYRPLIESYKSQIATLESKHSTARKESDRHESELNGAREKLARLEEERARERDGTALLEERIKELELGEKKGKVRDPDDSDDDGFGVGAELDDALSGTTTTSLKLRIRKLERQLEAAATNGGDASQVAVLEHLLEDSRKMKDKYEGDYLKETRERIKVERKLEEILSGKSRSADSPEVAIALRQRLNETVEELETVRKQLAEIEVNFESQQRELTIAKSNLNLVNKDQLEILESLRASVSVEQDKLAEELARARESLKVAEDKAKSHRDEIDKLLREKIELQGEGINQRDKMLEREKEFGGLSDVDRTKLAQSEQENSDLRNQVESLEEKLQKMKAFIKSHDKELKAEISANYEETIQEQLSQISQLREDLSRQITRASELEVNYQREHELILSAWHDNAMRHLRKQVLTSSGSGSASGSTNGEREYQPQSWIKQQRLRANGKPLRQA
ncbi:hypothetical protein JCM3766R1_001709 [Sporobolomyces carnicolor]